MTWWSFRSLRNETVAFATICLAFGATLAAAPLAARTSKVLWLQSRTRLACVGYPLLAAAALIAGLELILALASQEWLRSSGVSTFIRPSSFDQSGVVLVGYGLFSLACGAGAGVVVRRTDWAVGLGACAVASGVRLERVHGWVLARGFAPARVQVPRFGRTMAVDLMERCPSRYAAPDSAACYRHADLHYLVVFHPESQYWALQLRETGCFVAAAAGILGGVFLAVHRGWVRP